MAWIDKLYQTYEACRGKEPPGSAPLLPVAHTLQQAHIEIVLDEHGNFKGAGTVQKIETVIPATESSAGRTSGEAPHPLCDKIHYCAHDYPHFGGRKPAFFESYEKLLASWCASPFAHLKAKAVLTYVRKGNVVSDLIREKVLHLGEDGKLLTRWIGDEPPDIFGLLTAKAGERDQGDAFVRWRVRLQGDPDDTTFSDPSLYDSWSRFTAASEARKGVCMVTGAADVTLALSHPKRIRHPGDGAKLISANDSSGYTFRGRFTDEQGVEACSVGSDVSQKAHSALRWLVSRQGFRNGDQRIVTWAISGKPLPDPFQDTLALILGAIRETEGTEELGNTSVGDAGQFHSLQFRRAMLGYRALTPPTEDVVVMGLDSAVPGRMAIVYYRELKGSEFFERVEKWHSGCAWPQDMDRSRRFTGAPSLLDIAETAHGARADEKLRKAAVERLLPCVIDGQPLPRDMVTSTVRRAVVARAVARKKRDRDVWEKYLGVACALFRGWSHAQGKEYEMALEETRDTRDYLFGRLLAVADNIEAFALTKAEASRDTTAGRLMQRFADRPFSTWRTIELALTPYKTRLRSADRSAGFLHSRTKLLDEILCRFRPEDFTSDRALSGEFLLGFHCQRASLLQGARPQESAAPLVTD